MAAERTSVLTSTEKKRYRYESSSSQIFVL